MKKITVYRPPLNRWCPASEQWPDGSPELSTTGEKLLEPSWTPQCRRRMWQLNNPIVYLTMSNSHLLMLIAILVSSLSALAQLQNQVQGSLSNSHINSQNTGQPANLSLSSFIPFTSFYYRPSFLITLSRYFLTSRIKIANTSFPRSAPVLWNSLTSDLRHVAHHGISSPTSNSPVFDLSTCLFLKKLKLISFTVFFLLSLYSPRPFQDR